MAGDNDDDDKPWFELKMGMPSKDRENKVPELTREQRQELIDERLPEADISAMDSQIAAELIPPDLLEGYSPEEQAVLKTALAKECFRVWGDEHSKIEGIVCHDDGSLEAKVDRWFYASINPEAVLANHKAQPETLAPVQETTAEKTPIQEPEGTARNNRSESALATAQELTGSEPEQTPEAVNTTSVPDQYTIIPEQTPVLAQSAPEKSQSETTIPEAAVPEQNSTQELQDALNERYEQKMAAINKELDGINETRLAPDYWEGDEAAIAQDTARANELMVEQQALYELQDQSVNEQLEYFRVEEEAATATESQVTETITAAESSALTTEELAQLDQDLKAIDEEYATRVRVPEKDPSLLDSLKAEALDTFDTSAALLETVAKETVNFGTKMGMNVGATALGAVHGLSEGSLDEAISAMRSIRDEAMGRYRIETSDFAKEQLSQSALAEIGAWMQEKGEAAYTSIEEKYGTNVAELVKGSLGAGVDIAGVLGAGAVAKSALRATATTPPSHIYLKTNDISKIYESGRIWGQTEGSVYGMKIPDAPVWRTMIDSKTINSGTITLEGQAAALFKPHPIEGPFSGMKRALGQYKTPFGDIVFDKATATFDPVKGNLTIRNAAIGEHAERNILNKGVLGFKIFGDGVPVTGNQYSDFAALKLWGRRSIELGIDAGIGATVYFKTKE